MPLIQPIMPQQQGSSPAEKILGLLQAVNKIRADSQASEANALGLKKTVLDIKEHEDKAAKVTSLKDKDSNESKRAQEGYAAFGFKTDGKSAQELIDAYGPLSELNQKQVAGNISLSNEVKKMNAKPPKGYTWQTNPETGARELVSSVKPLPADKVLSVNEGNSIPKMLEDVQATVTANADMFGPVAGRMAALNPYNEKSQTMDAQMRAASQAFGRKMEGGVLRKEDEDKYRKMFPQLSDTPEVAQNKLTIVNRLLAQKQNSDVEALKTSGYDVKGVQNTLAVPNAPGVLSQKPVQEGVAHAGATPKAVPNAQDIQAMQWLKANPNDPHAASVQAALRAKGL